MGSIQTKPTGRSQSTAQPAFSIRILLVGLQPEEGRIMKDILQPEEQCQIIGECDTPASALKILRQSSPDILIFDADQPNFRSTEFLQSRGIEFARATILLASDPRIGAFPPAMNIIDYLSKPATEPMMRLSLAKAKGEIVLQKMLDLQKQIERLSEVLKICSNLAGFAQNEDKKNGQSIRQDRMVVKENGRLKVVRLDEIGWIEAWRDYVRLHCEGKTHIIHHTIGDLEARLDSHQFLRIGRSIIVNVDRISELEPLNHGDFLVVLKDKTQLNFSRHYRDRLSSVFGYRF